MYQEGVVVDCYSDYYWARQHLNLSDLAYEVIENDKSVFLEKPSRQRISKSTPLQPQPNNNPSQCQCHHAPSFQKEPTSLTTQGIPRADDNTSS